MTTWFEEVKCKNIPNVLANVSAIQLISRSPVPISGAGTSIPGPVLTKSKIISWPSCNIVSLY